MYNRYKYIRTKKPEESNRNFQNKESNIPKKYTGYSNYRNYRQSPNTELFTKTKNKNVTSPENKNTTQEFVNKPKYRSTKTSQPTESETAKNYRGIKTNEKIYINELL